MPGISVLITTHRRATLLDQALASLHAQSFSDWEAIVVDNGASAETAAVIACAQDHRIRYVQAPRNLGECGGRNLALRYAHGDFICYLDDDDLLPVNSLLLRMCFLRRHPDCGMIYCDYEVVRRDARDWQPYPEALLPPYCRKSYYDNLLARLDYSRREALALLRLYNFVRGGTPLIRRAVFDRIGTFDESFSLYGDYDMWLRIVANFRVRFLPKPVYVYRLHEGSISSTAQASAREAALRLCLKHGIRKSVQFGHLQGAIQAMWQLRAPRPPNVALCSIPELKGPVSSPSISELGRGGQVRFSR